MPNIPEGFPSGQFVPSPPTEHVSPRSFCLYGGPWPCACCPLSGLSLLSGLQCPPSPLECLLRGVPPSFLLHPTRQSSPFSLLSAASCLSLPACSRSRGHPMACAATAPSPHLSPFTCSSILLSHPPQLAPQATFKDNKSSKLKRPSRDVSPKPKGHHTQR